MENEDGKEKRKERKDFGIWICDFGSIDNNQLQHADPRRYLFALTIHSIFTFLCFHIIKK